MLLHIHIQKNAAIDMDMELCLYRVIDIVQVNFGRPTVWDE